MNYRKRRGFDPLKVPSFRPLPPMVLLLCICYPAVLTFVSFWLEIGYPVSYAAGKVLMMAIPLAAWRYGGFTVKTILPHIGLHRTRGLTGLSVGILFAGCILSLYFFVASGFGDRSCASATAMESSGSQAGDEGGGDDRINPRH